MIYALLAQSIVREELLLSHKIPTVIKRSLAEKILALETEILQTEKEIDKSKLKEEINYAIVRRFAVDFQIDCTACTRLPDCVERIDAPKLCDDFFLIPTIQSSITQHKKVAAILAERHGIDIPSLFLEIDTLLRHFIAESRHKLVTSFRGL